MTSQIILSHYFEEPIDRNEYPNNLVLIMLQVKYESHKFPYLPVTIGYQKDISTQVHICTIR